MRYLVCLDEHIDDPRSTVAPMDKQVSGIIQTWRVIAGRKLQPADKVYTGLHQTMQLSLVHLKAGLKRRNNIISSAEENDIPKTQNELKTKPEKRKKKSCLKRKCEVIKKLHISPDFLICLLDSLNFILFYDFKEMGQTTVGPLLNSKGLLYLLFYFQQLLLWT